MNRFERTRLWKQTLASVTGDPEEKARERLRVAYLMLRERTGLLAQSVAADYPELTVHDLTHLDALWEMADLICGDNITLNACEGFVLGGAFLLHDLGICLAAYQTSRNVISDDPIWRDFVADSYTTRIGRLPEAHEVVAPLPEIRSGALAAVLRSRHAAVAEMLGVVSWKNPKGSDQHYLIEDSDLRRAFGEVIGRIAYSHGWPVSQVAATFHDTLGTPAGFDSRWTVDPLRIACILRLADACHLDSRRAPAFLRMIRKPSGVSDDHWSFQGKLHQPTLHSDRLTYTSGQSFSVTDFEAWWLCFDTLRMVDSELDQVDALLSDLGRQRFAARAVAGISEPARLAKLIPTLGWTPVDTQIRVSGVAQLVAKLGGQELYGKNFTVPIRELVQNAFDAIRARRLLESRPDTWGEVRISLDKEREARGNSYSLKVSDTGTGMSERVLVGELLDFGMSLWRSAGIQREFPGLAGRGFESTGKYGIGFFSLFMLGKRVRITTRRLDEAPSATRVLEFSNGLKDRPILRSATSNEFLAEAGTTVQVWLRDPPSSETGGLLRLHQRGSASLAEICTSLFVAAPVSILVRDDLGKWATIITADDWKSIKPEGLLRRVSLHSPRKRAGDLAAEVEKFSANVRSILDDQGEAIARCCIIPFHQSGGEAQKAIVVVGGIRACESQHIAGILAGGSLRASREVARPLADGAKLAAWATEQADLFHTLVDDIDDLTRAAEVVHFLGGDTKSLPIARSHLGWHTRAQLFSFLTGKDEILILQDAAYDIEMRRRRLFQISENVVAVAMGQPAIIIPGSWHNSYGFVDWPEVTKPVFPTKWAFHQRTIVGLVAECAAAAWSCNLKEVLDGAELSTDKNPVDRVVGIADGVPFSHSVYVIYRPRKKQIT